MKVNDFGLDALSPQKRPTTRNPGRSPSSRPKNKPELKVQALRYHGSSLAEVPHPKGTIMHFSNREPLSEETTLEAIRECVFDLQDAYEQFEILWDHSKRGDQWASTEASEMAQEHLRMVSTRADLIETGVTTLRILRDQATLTQS